MLEEECDYVVKRLVCASNDAKILDKNVNISLQTIKIKCILLDYE